jgi:DNA invertase Pin-like site-specific DNA recombinase
MTTKPLIPYLRQSRTKERSVSIEEQRRDVTEWARANGATLANEIVEESVSGSKPWRERELGRAVEACERGEAQGIIVAWQDRLSRENGLATAEVWNALERANARLVCAAEGLDTDRGDQELVFSIKAAIAREQWKRYGANWQRTVRGAIERGVYVSTLVPVGFARGEDKRLVPDEQTAPIIRELFQRRGAGESWEALARFLDSALSKPDGRKWGRSTVTKIIKNRAYLGEAHQGKIVNRSAHPAIVTRAKFERAQPVKGESPRRSGSLLVGVLSCGSCGRPLGHTSAADYGCRSRACSARAYVRLARADAYVTNAFLAWFDQFDHVTVALTETAPNAPNAAATLEIAEDELRTFLERDQSGIPSAIWNEAKTKKTTAVDDARDALLKSERPAESISEVHEFVEVWDTQSTAEKRDIMLTLIERVVVAKGTGPVAERLTIVWRPI